MIIAVKTSSFLRRRSVQFVAGLYALAVIAATRSAVATPQFARETKLPCGSCHSSVPLLNTYGQKFYANGFRLPRSKKVENLTAPLWADLEIEGEGSRNLGNSHPTNWDCSLLASFGSIDSAHFLYHAEYLPVVNNTFIYGIESFGNRFSVAAGQLELLSQYDTLLDISPTVPIYLNPPGTGSTGLPGIYGPFAPSGTTYGLRSTLALDKTGNALPYSDGWKAAMTTSLANEVAYGVNQPKLQHSINGEFLETYYRQGMNSYGLNSFFGSDGRHYYGAVVQQKLADKLLVEGGAAYNQFALGKSDLASVGIDYFPAWNRGFSFRIDDQDGFISYVPSISYLLGARETAARLVFETQFTRAGQPTTTVTLDFKF